MLRACGPNGTTGIRNYGVRARNGLSRRRLSAYCRGGVRQRQYTRRGVGRRLTTKNDGYGNLCGPNGSTEGTLTRILNSEERLRRLGRRHWRQSG